MIIFLSIALLLVFGMHFAVFKSAVFFFNITGLPARILIYAAMVLLSLSFISAFLLLHWRQTPWTIGFYRFAATWTGFLIHFAVATATIWTMIGIGRLAGYPVNCRAVASFFLLASACWSVYGMWSSFHPVVREIAIKIEGLPKNWEGRTIVQLSDVHLGYSYGKSFAKRVVDQVNALKPDLIVITGDILDGMGGDFMERLEPINHLNAPSGSLFVTGNHEYYVGIDRALKILKKTSLRILNNELITIDGLEILGVGYPGIKNKNDIANLPENDTGKIARILLFHTPTNLELNSAGHPDRHVSTYWMPDTTFEPAKSLGIGLQLSGHTHHGQIFPFNFLTRLLFKGHDYGLVREGGFQLLTSAGTGSWGPPMRTSGRPEIVLIHLQSGNSK